MTALQAWPIINPYQISMQWHAITGWLAAMRPCHRGLVVHVDWWHQMQSRACLAFLLYACLIRAVHQRQRMNNLDMKSGHSAWWLWTEAKKRKNPKTCCWRESTWWFEHTMYYSLYTSIYCIYMHLFCNHSIAFVQFPCRSHIFLGRLRSLLVRPATLCISGVEWTQ